MFIEFCCDESIDNIKRYFDKTWSNYNFRLKNTAELKGIYETQIMKKLRTDHSPRELQMLFFAI